MDRESDKFKTKEEILREFQEMGFLDSNGGYTPPYWNLGQWIDECTQLKRNNATDAIEFEEC